MPEQIEILERFCRSVFQGKRNKRRRARRNSRGDVLRNILGWVDGRPKSARKAKRAPTQQARITNARVWDAWESPKDKRERVAGFFAGVAMAVAGVMVGAFGVYLGGQGAQVDAARFGLEKPALREGAPLSGPAAAYAARARYVSALSGDERLKPLEEPKKGKAEAPVPPAVQKAEQPKIIIVFDDMGPDKKAFETIMGLPGPVTLSFLPYAEGLDAMAMRARARGDSVLLHLPMEPIGPQDPGPMSLQRNMSGTALLDTLNWNLNRFSGYIGVNNHMGSAFTQDLAAMKTVLSVLKQQGLFFLDSRTIAKSTAVKAGREIDAQVFSRDVFLDPDLDRETVYKQLQLVEKIAVKTGYAVAICHPRKDTIDVIGPWLTSAPARGFTLATVESLVELDEALRAKDQIKASYVERQHQRLATLPRE